MAQVRWTPQALDDLDAICLFIARDAPQVAAVFADRAFSATDRLVDHPRLGRIVPELEIETIHCGGGLRPWHIRQNGKNQFCACNCCYVIPNLDN